MQIILLFILTGANVFLLQAKGQVTRFLQVKKGSPLIQLIEKHEGEKIPGGKPSRIVYEFHAPGFNATLPEGEHFTNNAGNMILTGSTVKGIKGDERFIHTYRIEDDKIKKQLSLKLPANELSAFMCPNQNIVTTDEHEGLGYEIFFYNSSLEKVSNYRPFVTDGFDHSLQSFLGTRVVYVFHPVKSATPSKLALFNTESGQLLFEKEMDGESKITNVQLFGEYTIITRSKPGFPNEIVCLNPSGGIHWVKQKDVVALQPFFESKWFAFYSDKKFFGFIDVQTGRELQKFPIESFLGSKEFDRYNWLETTGGENGSMSVLFCNKNNRNYSYKLFAINNTKGKLKEIYSTTSEGIIELKRLWSKVILTNSSNKIIFSYEN